MYNRIFTPFSPTARFSLTCAAALTLLAWSASSRAQTWRPMGPSPTIMSSPDGPSTNVIGIGNNPVSGAMSAVLPSPTDPSIMFAGAVNGGIWQTSDGGLNWRALGDDLPSLSIGAMTFDQSDPHSLWVGFGKQSSYMVSGAHTGIVRFDTRTGAWSAPLSTDLMGKDISRIIANGDNILVGVKTSPNEAGVWRSTDGGRTFTNSVNALPNGNISGLVGDLGNPSDPSVAQHYYAAVIGKSGATGVYRSDNAGQDWTHLSNLPIENPSGSGQPLTQDIMLTVAHDGTVVASVISPIKTDSGLLRVNPQVIVYRSSDHGATWTEMGSPSSVERLPDGSTVNWGIYTSGQFNLHGALLVDPNDSNVVYISGDAQGPSELIGTGQPTSIGASTYSGRLFRGTYDPIKGETSWEAITDNFTANGSGPHADSRFMMLDAAGNLLESDDGGIFVRTDPKTSNGTWLSLNGNLQTGEVHDARWNSLSHTIVTAMQDNGATVQLRAGDPTHAVVSGGDGGIAAVNSNWQIDGQRYAAAYLSGQYLANPVRLRMDANNGNGFRTALELGVERNGEFKVFGDGAGAIKPPRPRKPVTKGQAEMAQTQGGVEVVPFYPAFSLNNIDATRFALGGYDLYIGQDTMAEFDDRSLRIAVQPLGATSQDNPGFISVAYGARDNADALLGGTGYRGDISAALTGQLYYTPDAGQTAPVVIHESTGRGIQAALFDRALGTDRVYFSDGLAIQRGAPANGSYAFIDISGNLPASFNERRALDQIYNNGVSALVTAGTHNVAGGNWLYTLRGAANTESFLWDTRLGRLPNSQVFGLDYSVEDDVLLSYTMGRGTFALNDVTTYFPEATRLVFGQAGNDSEPINAQLTDGESLEGAHFSRPLVKVGSGVLNLAGTAAQYSGGTQLNGGLTLADADANLGAAGTGISFDGGRLNLLDGFVLDKSSGKFNRPLTINFAGGTLDTANNDIPFAGSIDGIGALNFLGRPLRIAGDIRLNASWNGPMNLPAGNTLRGTGRINGSLTVGGALYPGNSPGTLTVAGPVTQLPGSAFAVDIDGTGMANGAGNYSRLLVMGAGNTYTAGGSLRPVLRGITGAASNRYTPDVGQGFTVVDADGGVLGSYSSLVQPAAGLPAGSRMDAVYREQAIQLYVTPASYASLEALNVQASGNQRQVGTALESIRPAAGVRAPSSSKPLFDALAPVSATGLARALDQVGGVSHAQLLWADLNNSKFMGNRLMEQVSARRRTERRDEAWPLDPDGSSAAWARALSASSRMDGDSSGYGYSGRLDGIMAGFERRISPTTAAGLALIYVNNKVDVNEGMGSGRLQNWTISAYGSREDNGWFMQGAAGFGMGQTAARRTLGLPGIAGAYRADLRSRNITLTGQTGWYLGERDAARLETWVGLQYINSRHLAASERDGEQAAVLDISAGTLQSLAASAGLGASMPFTAAGIVWRASLNARISQEMLDRRPAMVAGLLDNSLDIKGAGVGRTSVAGGMGLAAQLNRRVSLQADVMHEMAKAWRETTAGLSLRIVW